MKKQSIQTLLLAVFLMPGVVRGQRVTTLPQLFALAEEQSQSIKSFKTAAEASEHQLSAAKAQRLPDISASLSVGYLGDGLLGDRDFSNWQHIDNPHFTNNFVLKAQQLIYAGGAIESAVSLAEMDKRMSLLDLEKNRQEIRFLISSHYLDLCRLQNRQEVVEKNIELTEKVIANMQAKHRQGTVLHTDITRYELQLESQMLLYGVKSVYGWACYACAALVIGFFLFDSPIRRHRSYMIPWRMVGEAVRKYYDVKSSGEDEQ